MNRSAIEHLKTDRAMARVVERIGPIDLTPQRLPTFQSLIHAIIHQQLSGSAASAILGRFQSLFDCDGFPSPRTVISMEREKLRTAGLSAAKASYIADIARRDLDGLIPTIDDCDRMTDEGIVQCLTTIKGVGRWTVEMLLIFNLGRPDVLPIHDLGIRRGYQVFCRRRKLPDPKILERRGKKWRPYRTAAALYLWRIVDSLKDGD